MDRKHCLSQTRWIDMNARERRCVNGITLASTPLAPGVYAFYRDGDAVYVGKATNLRSRLWTCHLRTTASMTNSALRRNFAQHLGIATATDIKARRHTPTLEDARRVTAWIREWELAWLEFETEAEAVVLETELTRERSPTLRRSSYSYCVSSPLTPHVSGRR
jgi:excinuclease UvrABC nuclease subunit